MKESQTVTQQEIGITESALWQHIKLGVLVISGILLGAFVALVIGLLTGLIPFEC